LVAVVVSAFALTVTVLFADFTRCESELICLVAFPTFALALTVIVLLALATCEESALTLLVALVKALVFVLMLMLLPFSLVTVFANDETDFCAVPRLPVFTRSVAGLIFAIIDFILLMAFSADFMLWASVLNFNMVTNSRTFIYATCSLLLILRLKNTEYHPVHPSSD
jgi:hypothetical protein